MDETTQDQIKTLAHRIHALETVRLEATPISVLCMVEVIAFALLKDQMNTNMLVGFGFLTLLSVLFCLSMMFCIVKTYFLKLQFIRIYADSCQGGTCMLEESDLTRL